MYKMTSDSKPLTIDSTNLKQYYATLPPETVKNDVELMKEASLVELYELIAENCRHYVSILENYREENLQQKFHFVVRRIEGHLQIQFKLKDTDRWNEVGFFDNGNTDDETMSELKNRLKFYLKHYDEMETERRVHLAAHMDKKVKSYFLNLPNDQAPSDKESFDFSQFKTTDEQRASSGYSKIPEGVSSVSQQTHEIVNLDEFLERHASDSLVPDDTKEIPETKPELKSIPNGPEIKKEAGSVCDLSYFHQSLDREAYTALINRRHAQQQLNDVCLRVASQITNTPVDCQGYLYQYLTDLVKKQDPLVVACVLVEVFQKVT
jgi:hypothetical protein